MLEVLFVCSGNICRSPTAEGVFGALLDEHGLTRDIGVDSAGLGAWHVGEAPDRRAQAAARQRGIELGGQRARQARAEDFRRFDYVIAMDESNRDGLARLCPAGAEGRIHLFLDFAPGSGRREVPDPYYGAGDGFDTVLDLIEAASRGLLAHIRAHDLS
jgi:protein-tyrosine phosphatase